MSNQAHGVTLTSSRMARPTSTATGLITRMGTNSVVHRAAAGIALRGGDRRGDQERPQDGGAHDGEQVRQPGPRLGDVPGRQQPQDADRGADLEHDQADVEGGLRPADSPGPGTTTPRRRPTRPRSRRGRPRPGRGRRPARSATRRRSACGTRSRTLKDSAAIRPRTTAKSTATRRTRLGGGGQHRGRSGSRPRDPTEATVHAGAADAASAARRSCGLGHTYLHFPGKGGRAEANSGRAPAKASRPRREAVRPGQTARRTAVPRPAQEPVESADQPTGAAAPTCRHDPTCHRGPTCRHGPSAGRAA